jgi:16S rRNA (uracil1498-N3)-methyltransferase
MTSHTPPPGTPTFYLPPEEWREPWLLEGAEQRHYRKVLRGRAGDLIRLLDGMGRIGIFEVLGVEKERSLLHLRESWIEPAPEPRFVLAVGWNKSLRRSWLMEKAAELGCHGLLFWQAVRSQGQVPAQAKDGWKAQLIAGAKQSVNPWVPSVQTCPGGVTELAEKCRSFDHKVLLWEEEERRRLEIGQLRAPGSHLFVLGPEGGFDTREAEELSRNGFVPMSLGNRILRWETAALLCLGLFWWSSQQRPGSP